MKKKTKVWVLTSTDLLTENIESFYSNVNFIKYFSKKKFAKQFAESDYDDKIEWKKQGKTLVSDLVMVEYHITRLVVEK